jgi:signal transduction histidine kinase
VLCAAGRAPRDVDESTVSMMEYFARLIADHVSRDKSVMTEVRADAAEEKLRERALFLAKAEEQLESPLQLVVASARTLQTRRDRLSDDAWYNAVVAIHVNAQALTRQIDKLLEEAHAEVQARSLRPERLDLSDLLQTTAKGFDPISDHEVRFDGEFDVWARADRAALHRVLGNLIDNAVKYSPGGGEINLRARRGDRHVEFQVRDAGVGMVEDVDVFAPFQRAERDATMEVEGAGLGLYIVRNLVEAMGGTVSAEANESGGSTLSVRLPAAP